MDTARCRGSRIFKRYGAGQFKSCCPDGSSFVLMLKPAVAMSAQPDMTVSVVSLIETVLFLAIALWLAKSKRYE